MTKGDAKLRTFLIVLSLMAVLSVTIGAYLYYSALREFSLESAHKEGAEHLKDLANPIDSYLTWSLKSVKSLAGLGRLKQSLLGENIAALAEANAILDHFCDAMQVSVCYLMDRSGNTIASSNRDAADSFVGKNYAFRPYFKQAMQGTPVVYMALGVASKQRGLYFSHPIYGKDKKKPFGVAVIMASVEPIEEDVKKLHDGIVLLTDPHGIIFVSSRADWLFHVLWKASPKTISDIDKTRQFGKGPWDWTGVKLVGEDSALDKLGNEYHVHQQKIINYPGWHLVYLHDHRAVSKKTIAPLQKSVGLGAVVLCMFFGLIVFVVFIKANTEIDQRKKAEKKLQESEKKFRAIAQTAQDAIIIQNRGGNIVYWNKAASNMFGYTETEVIGKSTSHLMPRRYKEAHKKGVERAAITGIQSVVGKTAELAGVTKGGVEFPIEVSLSMWETSEGIFYTGIARDISERKQSEKEREKIVKELRDALSNIKTLSGLLPICSHCKKIRDDKGYWSQVESYIHVHSGAEFSHGICPDCAKKHYSEFDLYDEKGI